MPVSDDQPRKYQMRPLKPSSRNQVVLVNDEGKRWVVGMARLVLTVYGGPCPPGYEPKHTNGDRTNCHSGNLEWAPRGDHGLRPDGTKAPRKNPNCWRALTDAQALEIRNLARLWRFQSTQELRGALSFECPLGDRSLRRLWKGETYTHVKPLGEAEWREWRAVHAPAGV